MTHTTEAMERHVFMGRYRREIIIGLALLVAVVVVFGQIRHHEFVNFDDLDYITQNPHVRDGWSMEGVKWAFTSRLQKHWHPVTWLSHMTDVELFGAEPRGHHLVSLLFHLINTLLLFWVLRRMTGGIWQSAFVAALFALHPLHVEPVAWVADRKDLLYSLFWILAIWAYTHYAARPTPGRYILVMGLFVLGLLAKPMMVTLPVVLILLDYWPLARLRTSPQDSLSNGMPSRRVTVGRAVLEKAGLFVFVLISGLVTIYAMTGIRNVDFYRSWTSMHQVAVSLVSYVVYILKMFWPTDLAVSYADVTDVPVWQAAGAALFLAAVTAAVIRWGRRRPYLPVGWFWYLVTLTPVIGLIQFGPNRMADRYTYIPLVGLFVMAAWGVPDLVASLRSRKQLLRWAAAAVLAACMIGSMTQAAHWKNSYTLFSHSIKAAPGNTWALHNFGAAAMARGRFDEAVRAFNEVVRLDPRDTGARNQLGIILSKQGRPEEALAYFEKALQLDPRDAEITYNMGLCLMQMGKIKQAQKSFEDSLRANPENEGAHNTLGVLLTEEKRYDDARRHFRQAIRIAPYRASGEYNMGLTYMYEGKLDEAKVHYRRAIDIDPNHAKAHLYLGKLLIREKDLQGALSQFNHVLRINPDDPEAHHAAGAILLGLGKTEQAKRHLNAAVQLVPENSEARRLLAQIEAGTAGPQQMPPKPERTVVIEMDDFEELYKLGLLMVKNNRLDEAREVFSEMLKTTPNHSGANYNLGVIAARQGQLAASADYFTTALETSPDDAQIHNNLGAVLAQQGRWDDAMKQFSEALRINPQDAKAKQNLALAQQLRQKAQKGK